MEKTAFHLIVYRLFACSGWLALAGSFVYIDRLNFTKDSLLYRPQDFLLYSYLSFLFAHKIKYAKATYETHSTTLKVRESVLIFICFLLLLSLEQWSPQIQCMTFVGMAMSWNLLLLVDEKTYLKLLPHKEVI